MKQLSFFPDHPRSTLFNLAPLGVGTPYVESLCSYIARLAIAHCLTVSILIADIISNTMGKLSLSAYLSTGGSRLYQRVATFHGQSQTTMALVAALESLTCRNDLIHMTFLPWHDFFDGRGLFRKYRAWCPECLETWKDEQTAIYEPLLWAVGLISICPEHYCNLTEACPACNRVSYALTPSIRPGYCPKCHAWLGRHARHESGLCNLSQFQDWTIESVKFILSAASTLHFSPSKHFVNNVIKKYIQENYKNSVRAFAQAAGFQKGTVNRWRSDQVLPTLENLLRISFMSRTPLSDLLKEGKFWNKIASDGQSNALFCDTTSRSRIYFNRTKVHRYLDKILSGRQSRPPTVTEVARTLGYSKKTLYKYFPKQCKLVAAAAKTSRSINKSNLIEQDSLFVRNAIEQLCLEGIYPSYDRVEALSPKKGILRRREVRKTWRDSTNEISFWDEI